MERIIEQEVYVIVIVYHRTVVLIAHDHKVDCPGKRSCEQQLVNAKTKHQELTVL